MEPAASTRSSAQFRHHPGTTGRPVSHTAVNTPLLKPLPRFPRAPENRQIQFNRDANERAGWYMPCLSSFHGDTRQSFGTHASQQSSHLRSRRRIRSGGADHTPSAEGGIPGHRFHRRQSSPGYRASRRLPRGSFGRAHAGHGRDEISRKISAIRSRRLRDPGHRLLLRGFGHRSHQARRLRLPLQAHRHRAPVQNSRRSRRSLRAAHADPRPGTKAPQQSSNSTESSAKVRRCSKCSIWPAKSRDITPTFSSPAPPAQARN